MGCQLILMRHAKSDHDDSSLSDHDRILSARGRRDTPRMAQWLALQGCIPQLILCSSSVRTQETADLLIQQWDQPPMIELCEDLYLSSPECILATIYNDNGGQSKVMVLAHNPGISTLASHLANKWVEMVTAAVAVFDVDDLDELGNSRGSENSRLAHRSDQSITQESTQGDSTQTGCILSQFASPKTI